MYNFNNFVTRVLVVMVPRNTICLGMGLTRGGRVDRVYVHVSLVLIQSKCSRDNCGYVTEYHLSVSVQSTYQTFVEWNRPNKEYC